MQLAYQSQNVLLITLPSLIPLLCFALSVLIPGGAEARGQHQYLLWDTKLYSTRNASWGRLWLVSCIALVGVTQLICQLVMQIFDTESFTITALAISMLSISTVPHLNFVLHHEPFNCLYFKNNINSCFSRLPFLLIDCVGCSVSNIYITMVFCL